MMRPDKDDMILELMVHIERTIGVQLPFKVRDLRNAAEDDIDFGDWVLEHCTVDNKTSLRSLGSLLRAAKDKNFGSFRFVIVGRDRRFGHAWMMVSLGP